MKKEEIDAVVKEAMNEIMAPVLDALNKKADKTPEPGVSQGVQDYISDKATDRLGGKDLFGKTPFNPNPKPKSEEKTV